MADNYIERQQEQYEARKAAWKQAQKYGKKKTGTTHQVRTGQADKIPSDANRRKRRVFVTGGAEGIGKAIVEAFSQADCLFSLSTCVLYLSLHDYLPFIVKPFPFPILTEELSISVPPVI